MCRAATSAGRRHGVQNWCGSAVVIARAPEGCREGGVWGASGAPVRERCSHSEGCGGVSEGGAWGASGATVRERCSQRFEFLPGVCVWGVWLAKRGFS